MSDDNELRQLRRALRERDAKLAEVETRLGQLENSTTYQVARVMANAGRGKSAARIPRQLYRLWKRRDTPRQGARDRRGDDRLAGFDRVEGRLLYPAPLVGTAIAGILAPSTAAALESDPGVRLVRLYPHVAPQMMESADADLLLVDAAAGAPGTPWAYLGVPGVYDRERALVEARDVARSRNIPVVLWGDNPPATLTRLDWDAVAGSATDPADLAGRPPARR